MPEPFALEVPDGTQWIIEPPVDPHGDGYTRIAPVRIQANGLQAHTTFTFSDGQWDPARFLGELAVDWRGWPGARRWRALEGKWKSRQRTTAAHVLLAATIKRPEMTFAADAWSARVVLALEAGEQLAVVARDLTSALTQ